MSVPSPAPLVEDLVPHNITPFPGVGRRGEGVRFRGGPRGLQPPRPSHTRIGQSVETPPAPATPKPAAKPEPAKAAPKPGDGTGRRVPKTGEAAPPRQTAR